MPRLARLLGKFVLDILPAALASVIGGFLFTQYHFGQMAAPRPAADQGAPASAEMVALVRDEHAMIMNYLKAQMAAEKSRDRRRGCGCGTGRSRRPGCGRRQIGGRCPCLASRGRAPRRSGG